MTDHRVMTAEATTAEAQSRRTEQLIGDGAGIDAETFAGLGLAERQRLFTVNATKYRELQAELDRATDLARRAGGR
jgi:hypothetical protein